jgi:hypothetical protein
VSLTRDAEDGGEQQRPQNVRHGSRLLSFRAINDRWRAPATQRFPPMQIVAACPAHEAGWLRQAAAAFFATGSTGGSV